MSISADETQSLPRHSRFSEMAFWAIGVLALIHLALGSSFATTASMAVCLATCVVVFRTLGAANLNTYVVLWFALTTAVCSAFVKPLMGESLDLRLNDPAGTYLVIAASVLIVAGTALAIERFQPPFRLFPERLDPRYLSTLSWVAFIIGTLFFILTSLEAQEEQNGWRVFRDAIFPVAIAARVAYLCRRPGEPIADAPLILFVLVSAVLVMFSGQKALVVTCGLVYLITILRFRSRIPVGGLLIIGLGFAVFALLFVPLINSLRYRANLNSLPAADRVDVVITALFDGSIFVADSDYSELTLQRWMPDYWGDTRGGTEAIVERTVLIRQLDGIKPSIDRQGNLPLSSLIENVQSQLPKLLDPRKRDVSSPGDKLLWFIGARGLKSNEQFPTIGIIGGAYGFGGMWGFGLFVAITFIAYFMVQSLVADYHELNLWAITSFVYFGSRLVQYDPLSAIFMLMRQLPLTCFAWFLCHLVAVAIVGKPAAEEQEKDVDEEMAGVAKTASGKLVVTTVL